MRVLVFGMSGRLTGGIETFLLNMNQYMSRDCIFDYVFMEKDTIHRVQIEKMGGRAICLTPIRENPLKNLVELVEVLRQSRKDHGVAYFNIFSMVHMVPVLFAKMMGYKVVLHAHNNNLEQKGKLYRWIHNVNRGVFSHLNCLRLTNSNESTEFMFGKNQKAELVYNAIDVERFRFKPDVRGVVRRELGVEDKTVFGFAGRLSPPKNPLFLIDVFEQIHIKRPDAVLLIAGEGSLRDQVETRIEQKGLTDAVKMLGLRKDVEHIYQAMDSFILPSIFEGLGIVLIEAQCSGLPCVTSQGVVPQLAKVTELVNYVPLEDGAQVWADRCIESVASESNDRAEYALKVRKSNFNIETESKRLEGILLSNV